MQRIKRERGREREREKKKDTKQLYKFLPQTGSSLVPLAIPRRVHLKCNIKLQLLNATTSKRLQITQAQLQEFSYAPEHSQETSNAQAQQQETSNQIELQKSLFEFEHLISNQWCSQYKSDTDS